MPRIQGVFHIMKCNEKWMEQKESAGVDTGGCSPRKAIGTDMTTEERRTRFHRTRGEELANGFTHLAGVLFGVYGLWAMLSQADGDVWKLVSAWIYGGTLILLTLSSTLYHFAVNYRRKVLFQFMDHCTIYFLLAGTFTPIALVTLARKLQGWLFFTVEWAMLVLGLLLECGSPKLAERFSLYVYLFMGWIILAFMPGICRVMDIAGIGWLFGGGVAYTSGVAFFLMDRKPYMHSVWHLFVLAGIFCHWMCIMNYVICPQ